MLYMFNMKGRFVKVENKNIQEFSAVGDKNNQDKFVGQTKLPSSHRIAPPNKIYNSTKDKPLPSSSSNKRLVHPNNQCPPPEDIDHQLHDNSRQSRNRNSDSFFLVDRVVQMRERLKNIHLFYKSRIDEEKNRIAQHNQVFMSIFQEMQNSHNDKAAALRKMIQEAEGNKKDVGLVDERMNEIKGSIDQILKQSSDLKISNERYEKQINQKEHGMREKQQELGKMKEELMEARNQLEGFERLNLKENKRNKQLVAMIDKSKENANK